MKLRQNSPYQMGRQTAAAEWEKAARGTDGGMYHPKRYREQVFDVQYRSDCRMTR